MLKNIIEEEDLGVAIGEADNGKECLSAIMTMHPDVVLIDLLMPEMDGIETIDQLKREGFEGQFVMISQIVNKEMVGEAYKKGVEFFIHKPINRIEVQSILKKIVEQCKLKESLLTIQESLANIGLANTTLQKPQSVKQIVLSILNFMGIIGESGSDDIVSIIEYLVNERGHSPQLPPLKELYEKIAVRNAAGIDVKKETKAIEQRIRRTILTAINNLASLGAIDYTNPEFEYYAPRYFDFQEIRNHMIHIQEGRGDSAKVKVNIKKFLQVLYLETLEKYSKTH